MGHSSITMTEKYRHVVDSLKQDAIHSLGSISYAMPWFTPWHFWHFGTLWWTLRPTSEGSSFSSVIIFGFGFGSAGVHICETEPTRIIKAMKNNNIENHLHFLHFCIFNRPESVKVQKMQRYFENIQRLWTHVLFALLHILKMPKCQECQGVIMK